MNVVEHVCCKEKKEVCVFGMRRGKEPECCSFRRQDPWPGLNLSCRLAAVPCMGGGWGGGGRHCCSCIQFLAWAVKEAALQHLQLYETHVGD